MSGIGERRALVLSAAAISLVVIAWVGGWAIREATDVDPTALALLAGCLRERGLDVVSPANDPLAASAPRGSLSTTIEGNAVTVSLWNDGEAAARTIATYDRLTSQDLAGRALARGDEAVLWAGPPSDAQAATLYGCTG